jgi:hypothetical protein
MSVNPGFKAIFPAYFRGFSSDVARNVVDDSQKYAIMLLVVDAD